MNTITLKSNREMLIAILVDKYNCDVRNLRRLSTRQLDAHLQACERRYSRKVRNYVASQGFPTVPSLSNPKKYVF